MHRLITFIIPAYNSEKYLSRCLSSFIHPALSNASMEVLIINDGSTDNTEHLANLYCKSYPNLFRMISKPNGGHGSVINFATNKINSKYFKVIDADDWISTNNLLLFYKLLEECDTDVVITHYQTFNEKTNKIKNWKTFLSNYSSIYYLEDIKDNWSNFCRCLTFHGITYNTNFYRQCNITLSENIFYEDQEFATLPLCQCSSIKVIDLYLYQYRIGGTEQSVSQNKRLQQISHTERVLLTLCKYANKKQHDLTKSGLFYLNMKISGLFLSHFSLLMFGLKNRKLGRYRASIWMSKLKHGLPNIYFLLIRKYRIFYFLSCLFLTYSQWEKFYESTFYNFLRQNNGYEY